MTTTDSPGVFSQGLECPHTGLPRGVCDCDRCRGALVHLDALLSRKERDRQGSDERNPLRGDLVAVVAVLTAVDGTLAGIGPMLEAAIEFARYRVPAREHRKVAAVISGIADDLVTLRATVEAAVKSGRNALGIKEEPTDAQS